MKTSPAAVDGFVHVAKLNRVSEKMIDTILFYFCLTTIVYIYAGYPAIVLVWGFLKPKTVQKKDFEPTVTILIAAYNEEACIGQTIQNKLALDYPPEKLNITVISDGSEDNTDNIVKSFADPRVHLLRQEPRAGKTAALNMAVARETSDILVFSDANSIYEPQALRRLVSNFADPQVGYVTGKMVYTEVDGTLVGDGCSAYMKYENLLRRAETRIGSVVGVDGGIDAVRRQAYRTMNPDQLPDFVLPLKVVEQGLRVVYEPQAILMEDSLKTVQDEYKMRVRVTLRALWALFDMRTLLFNKNNPLFAWQLWSHKSLRYMCFLFLVGLYGSNLALIADGWFYVTFFILQNGAIFVAAFYTRIARVVGSNALFRLVNYFAILNVAAMHACVKFIRGQKQIIWTPRKG